MEKWNLLLLDQSVMSITNRKIISFSKKRTIEIASRSRFFLFLALSRHATKPWQIILLVFLQKKDKTHPELFFVRFFFSSKDFFSWENVAPVISLHNKHINSFAQTFFCTSSLDYEHFFAHFFPFFPPFEQSSLYCMQETGKWEEEKKEGDLLLLSAFAMASVVFHVFPTRINLNQLRNEERKNTLVVAADSAADAALALAYTKKSPTG